MRGPLRLIVQRVSPGIGNQYDLHAHTMLVPCAENLGPYGATKFAVRGFTEVAAKEWAQYGIRVNGMYLF